MVAVELLSEVGQNYSVRLVYHLRHSLRNVSLRHSLASQHLAVDLLHSKWEDRSGYKELGAI